jgi:CDP-glucose 4,6-dehydratase
MLNGLEHYNGKKILVIGHTGFKGAWLSRVLVLSGARVFGLSLPAEPGTLKSKIENLGLEKETFLDINSRLDIDNFFTENTFEGVFHFAAQSLVIKSYDQPLETFITNVIGTAHILDSIINHKAASWVIVATTDKVYKNIEQRKGYKENDSLGGKDPYSASKAGTEMVVMAWQNLSNVSQAGVRIISVRAGNVIGGGDISENRLLPDLVKSFHQNIDGKIRNPKSIRPWQHVLDPLNGYLKLGIKLMLKKDLSNSYNFGPGKSSKLTVKQIAEFAAGFWGDRAKIVVDSGEKFPPESKLLWLNSKLAKRDLGWSNSLDAKEAVRWVMEWEKLSISQSHLQALDNQILKFFGSKK